MLRQQFAWHLGKIMFNTFTNNSYFVLDIIVEGIHCWGLFSFSMLLPVLQHPGKFRDAEIWLHHEFLFLKPQFLRLLFA